MQKFNLDSPTYKSLSKEVRDLCRTLIGPEDKGDNSFLSEAILYAAAFLDPEVDLPLELDLPEEEPPILNIYQARLAHPSAKWGSFGPGRKFYLNKFGGLPFLSGAQVGFFRGIQTLKSRYGYKETMISLIQFQFELYWYPGDLDYAWGDPSFWYHSACSPDPAVVLTQSVAKASLLTLNCQPCETVGLLSQSGFSFPLLLEVLSQGYTCDLPTIGGETTVILFFLAELIGKPINRIERSGVDEKISAEGLDLKSPDPFIQNVDDISTDPSSGKPRFEHKLEQKLPRWSQQLKRYLIFPPFSAFTEGTSSGYFAPSLKESADWIENLLESIEPGRRYCFFLNYRFLEAPHSWLATL
ncbi:hypothetical protein N9A78_01385, partial [Akkermansiaceae bacterium]|nr:hypothetical protein [Akkermansiaceae bacterium]